jgi:hypothetical protein
MAAGSVYRSFKPTCNTRAGGDEEAQRQSAFEPRRSSALARTSTQKAKSTGRAVVTMLTIVIVDISLFYCKEYYEYRKEIQ